jgi:hypothetical protein
LSILSQQKKHIFHIKFVQLFILVHYFKQSNVMTMGFTRPHSREVAHVCYQVFHSKMAHGDQLWSVENYLLRRNASTHGRKTDLIERYISQRKPKHTIYVRYFSILFLICLVYSLKLCSNKKNMSLWCQSIHLSKYPYTLG